MNIRIVEEKDIKILCQKASEVWHEHYSSLLSVAQIDYMVEKFQSEKAVREQLKEGYEYYLLEINGAVGGFVGIKKHPDYLYLSKFYILKDFRAKGYGRKAFNFLIDITKKAGLKRIQLNVNKENATSIKVYEKLGFVRYNSAVRDIGSGYVMDDYDYEYIIK